MTCQKDRTVLDRRNNPFVWVTKSAMKDRRLKASDKSVYAVLCMYADNQTMDCFPSRDTIMREAGVSDNTLRKCIAKLKDFGYIDVEKRANYRGQATNLYILLEVGDQSF